MILPYVQYQVARAILQKTLDRKDIHKDLIEYGIRILNETNKLTSSVPLEDLTETLKIANETISNPLVPANVTRCMQQGNALVEKYPKGKILAGLLLGLAGAALILASVAVAGFSFGSLTPLSIVGVTVGASMVAAAFGYEAHLLKDKIAKNKLADEMKSLAKDAPVKGKGR